MGSRYLGEKEDKMKQILILTLLILSTGATGLAQVGAKTNDDAAAVPDMLFTAMRAKNADGIRAVFIPEGQLVAIDKPRDGKGISKTRVFTADAFAKMIAGATGGDFIEKMPEKEVKISGDMGIVSGRYTFHVGDKFSHCGTNTFHLVRTEAGWKIANGASTLEFQCDADLKAVEIPVVAPDPADVSTIDGMIKAFYETISGPKGQPRQWGRDRPLYTKGVRFIQIGKPKDVRVDIMEYMDYVNGTNEFFLKDGFTEREIHRVTHRYGNIAQVFSTYEWQTDGKKASGRGINSIELFFDGTRWWISGASWEGERKDNPIPKEFLPKK